MRRVAYVASISVLRLMRPIGGGGKEGRQIVANFLPRLVVLIALSDKPARRASSRHAIEILGFLGSIMESTAESCRVIVSQ
jgi:hypothetical protein